MTCYILEDEPLAMENIKDYLSEWPNFQLIGSSRSPIDGIHEINRTKPQVLFLDINMPKLSGFEVLENLHYQPLVVFTTAYSEYALDGYNFEPVDYLLKPISLARFIKTVHRLEKRIQPSTSKEANKLVILDGKKKHFLEREMLLYIKSDRDYLEYHHTEGVIVSLGALRKEEERLKSKGFIRVHNSYMVNLQHIKQINSTTVQLENVEIPLGRSYKKAVNNLF